MIRNEQEYSEAVVRVKEEKSRLDSHRKELERRGFSGEELSRLIHPLESFTLQLSEEIESYERLKRREIKELTNMRDFRHALICLRIASGITQGQLAEKLGVDPSQVSRDERNEYHGVTIERAARIMEAVGAKMLVKLEIDNQETAMA